MCVCYVRACPDDPDDRDRIAVGYNILIASPRLKATRWLFAKTTRDTRTLRVPNAMLMLAQCGLQQKKAFRGTCIVLHKTNNRIPKHETQFNSHHSLGVWVTIYQRTTTMTPYKPLGHLIYRLPTEYFIFLTFLTHRPKRGLCSIEVNMQMYLFTWNLLSKSNKTYKPK